MPVTLPLRDNDFHQCPTSAAGFEIGVDPTLDVDTKCASCEEATLANYFPAQNAAF
jgi:hypothetical protein